MIQFINRDKIHFEEDGTQNDLVFQPMYSYFERVSGVGSRNHIYFWKFKGLSNKILQLLLQLMINLIKN